MTAPNYVYEPRAALADVVDRTQFPYGGHDGWVCKCGDTVVHGHLSMPDPPGMTRLELIRRNLNPNSRRKTTTIARRSR